MRKLLLFKLLTFCTIIFSFGQVPANDLIENAIEITAENFVDQNVRLDLATLNGIGGSDCGVDGFKRVYYKFTSTAGGIVTAQLTDSNQQTFGGNTFLIPYTSPDLNITNENQLLVLPGYCSFGNFTNFTAVAGQSYYIQVHRDLDAGFESDISINVTFPEDSVQADRDALTAFYNANDGINWSNAVNWNTALPVGSWNGVTVEDGRVTKLELINFGINGSDFSELFDLSELNTLNLSDNNFSGTIPDFSTLQNITSLSLDLNALTFADLETNFSQNNTIDLFTYSQQRPIDSDLIIDANVGHDYSLTMTPIAGTNVQYQWYKGGLFTQSIEIPGETSNTYSIINTQESDIDNYYCLATSPTVTGLIFRRDINLTAPVSSEEKNALISIYASTNGPNWSNNDGWLTSQPVREWNGITVAGNKVVALSLFGIGLDGTLPDAIGDLINLETLNISINENLTGSIPTTIENLVNLRILQLQANGLSGVIPSSIGNLSELTTLNLLNNNLSGNLPSSIGNLSNLTTLQLSNLDNGFGNLNGNSFDGQLPTELLNLSNLQSLSVGNNNFSGELLDFSVLPNLTFLQIQNNKFSFDDLSPNQANNLTIDNYIFSPQRNNSVEETLDVSAGCDISIDYEGLTVLEIVDIPTSTNNNLYRWFFNDNQLSGITNSKYQATNLQPFSSGTYYCEITNPLVENLVIRRENVNINIVFEDAIQADKDALIAFYNANNGIDWTNSTNWLSTTEPAGSWQGVTVKNGRVTKLSLISNNIVGSDFTNLLLLDQLEQISLSSNMLSGLLPDFTVLPKLEILTVNGNQFSFADLETHFIQNNTINQFSYQTQNSLDLEEQIEGIIGLDIDLIMTPIAGTNVQYQWYKANQFTQGVTENPVVGATNSTLSLTNIQDTDLDSYTCYATSTTIPDLTIIRPRINLFGTVSQAERDALIVFYNALDGPNWGDNTNWTTTAPVRDWAHVTTAGNRVVGLNFFGVGGLTGQIPTEIENLVNLEYLGIAVETGVTGPIPASIGNLTELRRLRLQGTGNSGSLPASIGNLSNLEELRLIGNAFTGDIPSTFDNLVNLKDFYLIGSTFPFNGVFNQFTGELPDLTNSPDLFRIQVSGNDFSGVLPDYSILPNMNTLVIDENLYSFSDLEPNQTSNETIEFYAFSPQRNNSEAEELEIATGQSITLDVNGMTTTRQYFRLINTNQYQWYKDNEAINGATASTYTIANPQPTDSGVYFCEITNTTVDGLVVTRADITLNVNATLSVDDNQLTEIRLYPNPTKNWLTIDGSNLQHTQINIYDLNGRLVLKKQLTDSTTVLNVENLSAGTYILKLKDSENKTLTKRFIKQ